MTDVSQRSSAAKNVIVGTDCGPRGRAHPQIVWAKRSALRDGAATASKKLCSYIQK